MKKETFEKNDLVLIQSIGTVLAHDKCIGRVREITDAPKRKYRVVFADKNTGIYKGKELTKITMEHAEELALQKDQEYLKVYLDRIKERYGAKGDFEAQVRKDEREKIKVEIHQHTRTISREAIIKGNRKHSAIIDYFVMGLLSELTLEEIEK